MQILRTLRSASLTVCLMLCGITPAVAQEYRIHAGDVLEITVLEDPNLNRQVLVRPDGKISLPLAGTLSARGRTVEQVQQEVENRLAGAFVSPPTVSAALISLAPPKPAPPPPEEEEEEIVLLSVYVLGEVNRPGRYEYPEDQPITALQALALAGGPSTFAARSRIQIRQIVDDKEMVRIFDYEAIEDDASLATAPPLADGVVILVPERGLFE